MTALRFAWFALRREGRSGELAVLAYAIVVAVSALTTVGFFTDRIDRAIHDQATEILAADLRISSPGALAEVYAAEARRRGLATASTIAFPSVAFHDEASSLVSLYAVSGEYPLRGRIRIAAAPFGPAFPTSDLPARGEVWAESRLMAALGARIGDEVALGAARFRITRVLDHRPDQGSTFVDLAAGLLIRIEDLPSTQLLQEGSHRHRVALPVAQGAQLLHQQLLPLRVFPLHVYHYIIQPNDRVTSIPTPLLSAAATTPPTLPPSHPAPTIPMRISPSPRFCG